MITVLTGTGSLTLYAVQKLKILLRKEDFGYDLGNGTIEAKDQEEADKIIYWLAKHDYPNATKEAK